MARGATGNEHSVDQAALAAFLRELQVARKFTVSYPANHPMLVAADERAAKLGTRLLAATGALTLGVAKDALLVGDTSLDRQNLTFQQFARLLFSHGVMAITFSPGATARDLHLLNELLGRKPEAIRDDGGLAALLSRNVSAIEVLKIDYDAFTTTDVAPDEPAVESGEGLWHELVRAILGGNVDAAGRNWHGVDLADVAVLTQIVEEQGTAAQVRTLIDNYRLALASLSRQLRKQGGGSDLQTLASHLGRLIEGFSPQLRQQFLESTLQTLTDDPEFMSRLLESMNIDTVLASLKEMSDTGKRLPPLLLGLIQTLAANAGRDLPLGILREQDASEQLRELFREDDLDQFLPGTYREALQKILQGAVQDKASENLSPELSDLLQTTASHVLETKASDIIIEILRQCPDEEMVATLQRNLLELCDYFLGIGDFAHLIDLHRRLVAADDRDPLLKVVRDHVLAAFATPDFIQEVFQGLSFWGKAKYLDIQRLITTVGEPFIEPLLERLAEEQNMSLRRFYMDRLLEIGPVIQSYLLDHLRDSRWYFVRNVLVLLRGLNNPLVCKPIHRLINHPHPRVRAEVLRTMLHYGDAEADRILLQQLEETDDEQLLAALQLAEKSAHPLVLAKVLGFLDRGSLTNYEYRLKSAAIACLGEMANPAVLPRLEKILLSGALLHAGSHARLKADILRTLDHYPPQAVLPLLRRLIEKGASDLARQAADVARGLQRKLHGSGAENQPA